MKGLKKIAILLMALCLCTGMFLTTGTEVRAESKGIPKKIRIYPRYTGGWDRWNIPAGCTVKNIKTNSANLKAKLTYSESRKDSSESTSSIGISFYAQKEGTYTLSFDVYNAKGKKVSTEKIKVYVRSDSPVKSVSVTGLDAKTGYVAKKTGTLKVSMNPGYTLKKIEVGKNKVIKNGDNKHTEEVYTTVKNGSKITFNTTPYTYKYSYTSGSPSDAYYSYHKQSSKEAMATTYVRITYVDKYTKTEETTTYGYSKLLF